MARGKGIIHVVNRSLDMLEVMDDGIPWPIRPGYKLGADGTTIVGAGPGDTVLMEPLPYFAAERAKRQNPVMGTEDPLNPSVFQSLIAVPEWGDDYTPMQQTDAIERLDRSLLGDAEQKAEVIPARGARRRIVTRDAKGRIVKVDPQARGAVQGEAFGALENFAARG